LFAEALLRQPVSSYGSVGHIVGDQKKAAALLNHFGSPKLARASVEELTPFVSRNRAARLVSSLRLAAVALRQERSQLVIDNLLAVANLCAEMRFLSHESSRVILLNTKQQLIKVVSVSEGTVNESLAHPREILKPVILFSAGPGSARPHARAALSKCGVRTEELGAPRRKSGVVPFSASTTVFVSNLSKEKSTGRALSHFEVYQMIRRRAIDAGVSVPVCCH
jgi:hypothetical protein